MKDKMMICPDRNGCEYATTCWSANPHPEKAACSRKKCLKSKTRRACIPYEPQSWCNTCHKRVGCKGNIGQVISCPDYEFQSEPSPTDLQPKHCTHSWVKRNEGTNLVPYLECIYCKIRKLPEQPTPQMPLREQFEQACEYYGCNPEDALLDRLELIAVAYSQKVVAQAIKEFADILKWIAEHLTHIRISPIGDKMDIDYIDKEGHTQSYTYNDSECEEDYQEMLVKAVAHIRAMAEGKE